MDGVIKLNSISIMLETKCFLCLVLKLLQHVLLKWIYFEYTNLGHDFVFYI